MEHRNQYMAALKTAKGAELTDDEITQLAESVEFHIKLWPGYPAAEKEEQVRLLELRSLLRVGMLEVSFHKD